ncbi:Vitamin B12-dependent ribonucleotide reductase [Aquisphaera giovannonii]|uniref:Vitamin B12-dependent ribonucleotide reductase n=1 Tax=Aquisphaera giovannonii TaxID=406548 RepID=A0A5B9W4A6_9BACT|nr:vitamin B12-dependent ribonucleotide reductase [Aquisphaera giovannonii]QEH35432.1 Vitamin B12-dependent ribonucleotide reductase [Aquisphaera giovannonii]
MATAGERAGLTASGQGHEGAGPEGSRDRGRKRSGMEVPRVFSTEGTSPFDLVEWDLRSAEIKDERGRMIFQQVDCEIPKGWSQLATNVVVSKYFYGDVASGNGSPAEGKREYSVRQLVDRVTRTIADWGKADGYFATTEDADRFYDELTSLCLNQYGSFNSPVWFNVGLYHQYGIQGPANNWRWDEETRTVVRAANAYEVPQSSACFIQSVSDDMESIMKLAHSEAMLFKFGSGTGTDLSTLRSSREKLSGGGKPSGPVSFMRVYDAIASVVKSGGKTRRAAKMQTLKVWHPDILEFIECKIKEEAKAHALIREGYEANFNGEAYSSVLFQNSNLSIRCSDAFLKAAEADEDWTTRTVTTGRPAQTYKAKMLLDKIAEGTWLCGDPGMQYEDTIQRWHTCPNTAPINSSNPCSEYMFIDDSACNLSSLNLMKFVREDGGFDAEKFRAAVRIFITAQEILVDHASYPTDKIALNSHRFRPLGLGFANLGSLLMSAGLPYDSTAGRSLAAAITAIMHGQCYLSSAEHAGHVGPFEGFAINREPMLKVMEMHRDAALAIDESAPADLREVANAVWAECLERGRKHGYRNSQVTVLAPTGTIAFMMDCDTTGIEPDIALVKYKSLAGGGMLKIVNRTVPMALRKLGYDEPEIRGILDHVDHHDTIEGAPGLADEHLPVFDCAFAPPQGGRSIHYLGHIRMMAAVQPFLSGAISKTCNLPHEATIEDVREAYLEAWRLGIKALAIYRDGSKGSQPVSTESDAKKEAKKEAAAIAQAPAPAPAVEPAPVAAPAPVPAPAPQIIYQPRRERLPHTRRSLTHKFDIQGHEGYINVGFYPDGRPGELFITMAKEGSTIGGLMDVLGTSISIGLQYGVPLEVFVNKFAHSRFEPAGFTKNPDIPIAKSIADYIFRWMGMEFIPGYREANAPQRPDDHDHAPAKPAVEVKVNGHRTATIADLEHAEAVMGAKILQEPAATAPLAIEPLSVAEGLSEQDRQFAHFQSDAPACDNCGALTVRCGTCYRCFNCGNSMGCS